MPPITLSPTSHAIDHTSSTVKILKYTNGVPTATSATTKSPNVVRERISFDVISCISFVLFCARRAMYYVLPSLIKVSVRQYFPVCSRHGTSNSGALPLTYAEVFPPKIGDVHRPIIEGCRSARSCGTKNSQSLQRDMIYTDPKSRTRGRTPLSADGLMPIFFASKFEPKKTYSCS